MEIQIDGKTFWICRGNFNRDNIHEKFPKGNTKLLGQVWQDANDRWRGSYADPSGFCHTIKRKFFKTKLEVILHLWEFQQNVEKVCAE